MTALQKQGDIGGPGLTINTVSTAQNISINGMPTSIAFGSQVTGAISGGGTAGVIKTGSGNFVLGGTNTYTGGTHINGGFMTVNGAVTDAVFGATGAGNGLSFNGGSLLFNVTGGLTTNRDVLLEAGGGTVLALTATNLSGVISGSGALTHLSFGAGGLTLSGANTYTGATVVRAANNNTGTVAAPVLTTISGNGSIASSSSYDFMGTFTLSNTATNGTNRLSDTAAMTVRGINFVSTGNATAASSETIGAVTATNGSNTFLVAPGAGQSNALTMASLTRQNNATFTFRGAGLGGTPGAGVANIFATAAPSLVGGGGAAGSTTISVLPYAAGNSSTQTAFTAAALVGSSFVTYDTNGFRPLATAEYAAAFGGAATDNVRITAVTAAPATTVNSLLVAPAVASTLAAPVLTGGTINVTSGAVMYSPTANVTGFIGSNLNFGTAEGIISNTSTLTVSGVISGSNGLTLNTVFAPTSMFTPSMFLTGANTYTGNTVISQGVIGFSGTIDGNPGAFGTSGNIVLNAGHNVSGISATAASNINRDISVVGRGINVIAASASGYTINVNGNVNIATESNLNVYGFSNIAAEAVTFNGTISGGGSIRDVGTTFGVFNGNNTYSGGTTLNTSTYYAGSDTAFGTGVIALNGTTGAIAGVGTTPRTLANPVILNNTGGFAGAAPLTLTGAIDLNGSRTIAFSNTALLTMSGVVSNGSFTKGGTGALALNSPSGNTFTGGFVSTGLAATASVVFGNNTTGSAFGPGALSVGASSATVYSTLAGNFTTSGNASIGGRLSPGNGGLTPSTGGVGSIGTTSFGGNLTFSSSTTSSLFLEVGGPASADHVNVAGTLTLAGTVFLASSGGYTVQAGDTFDLVDFGAVAGTATINTSGLLLGPGVTLDTTNLFTTGVITAVPEPTTYVLIGLGGLALAGLRRRRN